jgi:ABC-type uncharacterized transport system substrate-binding protein
LRPICKQRAEPPQVLRPATSKACRIPAGNITGLYYRQPELAVKQLELMVEAFPDRKRVGALYDHFSVDQFTGAQRGAQSMGLTLYPIKLENPPYDFEATFRTLAQNQVQIPWISFVAFWSCASTIEWMSPFQNRSSF